MRFKTHPRLGAASSGTSRVGVLGCCLATCEEHVCSNNGPGLGEIRQVRTPGHGRRVGPADLHSAPPGQLAPRPWWDSVDVDDHTNWCCPPGEAGQVHYPPELVGHLSPDKRTLGAQTIQDLEWGLLVTSSPHEVPRGTPEGVRRARRRSRSATTGAHQAAGARSRRASSLWSAVRYPPKARALVQPRMARSSGSNKNVSFSRGRHLEPLEQGARARARPKPWRLMESQA